MHAFLRDRLSSLPHRGFAKVLKNGTPTVDYSYTYPAASPGPHPAAAFIQPKLLPKGLRGISRSAAISGLIQPHFCLPQMFRRR